MLQGGRYAKVSVFGGEKEASDFLVRKWEEIARVAIQERGIFVVALSGGKTPRVIYERLAELKEQLPWNRTHIFLVDERVVPFSHRDSNYGMLAKTLLEKVSIPPDNCHPIPVDAPSPEVAAREYEGKLRAFFHLSTEKPVFDLILLGLGEDGHTASLFPGEDFSVDTGRLATSAILDAERHNRLTLTLPVINSARNVVFVVTGRNKARVLRRVIEEGDSALPASLVRPIGYCLFVIDEEAASCLSGRKTRGEC